jgi:antitoxin PrlF
MAALAECGNRSRLSTAAGLKEARNFLTIKNILSRAPMITSKLTSKAQTTIPQPVRAALRLKDGDELAYEIEENRVILTKASAGTIDDPFATFGEWDGEADRKAYAKL